MNFNNWHINPGKRAWKHYLGKAVLLPVHDSNANGQTMMLKVYETAVKYKLINVASMRKLLN
jgi:hypothetical protein